MNLYPWAIKWGVSIEALLDLKIQMGLEGELATRPLETDMGEAGVTKLIRLEAANKGTLLWRNNVGSFVNENGQFVRFGIANDSSAMNKRIKSSDLIGIKDGGQFICREVKAPDWRYTGTAREKAQLKFIELVLSKGGDAAFATREGSL